MQKHTAMQQSCKAKKTRASENPNVMETGMPKPGRVNPTPSPDYAWPRLQRIEQPPWSTPGFCKSANVVPTWRAPTPKSLTQIDVFHIFPRSAQRSQGTILGDNGCQHIQNRTKWSPKAKARKVNAKSSQKCAPETSRSHFGSPAAA